MGSTEGFSAGLQAEAPSHLVKRWQQTNWQRRASTNSCLTAATSAGPCPRGGRPGDINRGAVRPMPISRAKDHRLAPEATLVGKGQPERDLSTG